MDAVLVHYSPHAAGGIDVGMSSYHGTGVQYAVASYFNEVAEHGSDFFDAGLDLLVSVLDYHKGLVGLDIGSDGTCSHVAAVSEDGIAYIVIVRSLNMVKKNNVLELYAVTNNTVSANQSGTSDEGSMTHFGVGPYDARGTKIC